MTTLSVIIPCLNEADNLATAVKSAKAEVSEILVVDGGSTDGTPELARNLGTRLLPSHPGRGRQMNAGAMAATGEILLFLHADSRLPCHYQKILSTALEQPGVIAGAFRLGIDSQQWRLRSIAVLANIRTRLFSLPYGDQGIFVRKADFFAAGGYPETAIMEDVLLIRQLRKKGTIAILPLEIHTSARRWQHLGVIRTTLINQAVLFGWALGVPWPVLARLYNRAKGLGTGKTK